MTISKELSEEQLDELARLILAVAEDKARWLKLEPIEYLLGILEGRFPPLDPRELAQKHSALTAASN